MFKFVSIRSTFPGAGRGPESHKLRPEPWTPAFAGARADADERDFTSFRRSAEHGFTSSRRSAEHGFTLVELMVVIVIIGLLATIVAINVIPATDTARVEKAKADIATIEQALEQYRAGADANRDYLRGLIGDEVEQYSDAELNDSGYNSLFPNFSPWSGWARIVYRFRPNGDNPDECLMQVMLLSPWPEGKEKPAPVPPAALTRSETTLPALAP